jgi:hypothetical protein
MKADEGGSLDRINPVQKPSQKIPLIWKNLEISLFSAQEVFLRNANDLSNNFLDLF